MEIKKPVLPSAYLANINANANPTPEQLAEQSAALIKQADNTQKKLAAAQKQIVQVLRMSPELLPADLMRELKSFTTHNMLESPRKGSKLYEEIRHEENKSRKCALSMTKNLFAGSDERTITQITKNESPRFYHNWYLKSINGVTVLECAGKTESYGSFNDTNITTYLFSPALEYPLVSTGTYSDIPRKNGAMLLDACKLSSWRAVKYELEEMNDKAASDAVATKCDKLLGAEAFLPTEPTTLVRRVRVNNSSDTNVWELKHVVFDGGYENGSFRILQHSKDNDKLKSYAALNVDEGLYESDSFVPPYQSNQKPGIVFKSHLETFESLLAQQKQ